jgi:hypothetical protein
MLSETDANRTKGLLVEWWVRADTVQRAHYLSAEHFKGRSLQLGVPSVVLSLFVGTSVFASLQSKPNIYLQITVGFCSVLAAVLAGLQTFLGYGDRAEKHRMAGAKYGAICRELEALIVSNPPPETKTLDHIREKLDKLALEAPANSKAVNNEASRSPASAKFVSEFLTDYPPVR